MKHGATGRSSNNNRTHMCSDPTGLESSQHVRIIFQECFTEPNLNPKQRRKLFRRVFYVLQQQQRRPGVVLFMDSKGKTGKLFLQPHKSNQKWKPVWVSLFPPSSNGVGRLEIRDMGGGGDYPGFRRHQQFHGDKRTKVVLLSELITVLRLPPNAEACPMENMSAFCVETQDRTLVFATLKDDCAEWVDKLCQSSFQREKTSGTSQVHMEENQIYASAHEAPQFWVGLQKSDAAMRCGLQGSYWLQVEEQSLLLRSTKEKEVVMEWPYELLRRYGNDKVTFTIEAGRRCESGPGTFIFKTQQADNIFSLIKSNIKRKTATSTSGHQIQDVEQDAVTNIQACSPLPKIPDLTNMAAIVENKLRVQDRKSPVFDDIPKSRDDSVCPAEGLPAPITLMPLPSVPTHNDTSGHKPDSQSDAIYADPKDCIPSIIVPIQTRAHYIDPASVLPLKPPFAKEPVDTVPTTLESDPKPNTDLLDSVYSEVYDKLSPDKNKQPTLQNPAKTSDEPIYSQPDSTTPSEGQETEPNPDQFAHLYAQVCKAATLSKNSKSVTTSASSSSTMSSTKSREDPLDDVIYENLGII
ncbi:docking protein 1-like isoform X1 [Cyprinodon tularosa]|uniref:docking protein 1-like isoform X1 n=2 Tax=Cyprinodon tularosa TaxID=77115 RepID=UPI0018E1F4A8|nr:docking protein 1-like isoform X1 [Cyprinodon tularosa]